MSQNEELNPDTMEPSELFGKLARMKIDPGIVGVITGVSMYPGHRRYEVGISHEGLPRSCTFLACEIEVFEMEEVTMGFRKRETESEAHE